MLRSISKALMVFGFLMLPMAAQANDDFPNRYHVMLAAHELDNAAQHFHNATERYSGYSHLANAVHNLNNSASHFHDVVEYATSSRHVQSDFWGLQRAYNHLSSDFQRAHRQHHDWHIQADWDRLEHAYYNLQDAFYGHGHGGGHR